MSGSGVVPMGEATIAIVGNVELEESLVVQIRHHHDLANAAAEEAIAHAVKVGEDLIRLKDMVPHGRWADYIYKHLPFKVRTAQNYMRLAANSEETQRVAHLGIKGALKALAEPNKVIDDKPEQESTEPIIKDFDPESPKARAMAEKELKYFRRTFATVGGVPRALATDFPLNGALSLMDDSEKASYITEIREARKHLCDLERQIEASR